MDYLSLCLSCRDENEYLAEWLDYHIIIGVERFYIYDNDSRVSLRKTLTKYIERGWVKVINIRGKGMQLHAYDHCLKTHGSNTFWLGFVDTDEFLVPKNVSDLKVLLRDYENYGGLAVSSLFFGSNGHQTKPLAGQIASYTSRTHETFQGNVLIKSIVQPGSVILPCSPHDFAYKEGKWCVNENFLFVDGMKFPCHTEKIQLNHYFCRSEAEIDLKINRGWADHSAGAWPRERFEVVNAQAAYGDITILKKIEEIFLNSGLDGTAIEGQLENDGLLNKMADLVDKRQTRTNGSIDIAEAGPSSDITIVTELKKKTGDAEKQGDYKTAIQFIRQRLEIMPQKVNLLINLSENHLRLGEASSAWASLSEARKIAPNAYHVLTGLAYFFLKVGNYDMAEKACHLLLEMAPHNLMIQGYLAEALMGLGRHEEALKVGQSVIELENLLGELPDGMANYLVKLMADQLIQTKDYSGAISLWEGRLERQKDNADILLELSRALQLSGDTVNAHKRFVESQFIKSRTEEVNRELGNIN